MTICMPNYDQQIERTAHMYVAVAQVNPASSVKNRKTKKKTKDGMSKLDNAVKEQNKRDTSI
jgi:hypothetical protein